jgi:hypothetical protein
MVSVPAADGVNETEQLPPESEQVPPDPSAPEPEVEKLTIPLGVDPVPTESSSLTVAVQDTACPVVVEAGVQSTAVALVRVETLRVLPAPPEPLWLGPPPYERDIAWLPEAAGV